MYEIFSNNDNIYFLKEIKKFFKMEIELKKKQRIL